MVSARHRFHSRASVQRVYRLGRVVRATGVALKYTTRSDNQPYRVAVVVSKKVHKSAVIRNRIRRRIYEIVRRGVRPDAPYDMVITVHTPEITTIPATDLAVIMSGLLGKAVVPSARPVV